MSLHRMLGQMQQEERTGSQWHVHFALGSARFTCARLPSSTFSFCDPWTGVTVLDATVLVAWGALQPAQAEEHQDETSKVGHTRCHLRPPGCSQASSNLNQCIQGNFADTPYQGCIVALPCLAGHALAVGVHIKQDQAEHCTEGTSLYVRAGNVLRQPGQKHRLLCQV